jgi:phosphate transport system permease protein
MSKSHKNQGKHHSHKTEPEISHTPGYQNIVPAVYKGDKVFNRILLGVAGTVFLVLFGIFITLLVSAAPSFKEYGLRFFSITKWFARMNRVTMLSAMQTPENKMSIKVKFLLPLNESSIQADKFILSDQEGALHTVVPLIDYSGISNHIIVSFDSPIIENTTNILSIKKSILDANNLPLADDYRCIFIQQTKVTNEISFPAIEVIDIVGDRYGSMTNYISEDDQRWFGGMPFIAGTLLTSILALLISLPFSMAIAIFLGEYFTSGIISDILKTTNELLAGIPSIIYGFWAFTFIGPLVYQIFPFSEGGGSNILTASLVLAIMIIPYSASLAREVINLVPGDLKEAAYAMGGTRYEVVRRVIIPYSSSGILAGILLAFGRALGETMAVTLVIGNRNEVPMSIFSSGQTIASLIASKYAEGGKMQIAALTELGLILFVITLLFGLLGRYLIKKLSVR